MLGRETYFQCSPLTGAAVTEEEQPELFARLMEIQNSITSDLDAKLYKHYAKIDKIAVEQQQQEQEQAQSDEQQQQQQSPEEHSSTSTSANNNK